VTRPPGRGARRLATACAVLAVVVGVGWVAIAATGRGRPEPAPPARTAAPPVAPAPAVAVPTPPTDAIAPTRLTIPVAGVAASALRDTFHAARGERAHEALDIAAPTGTAVLAADDGTVAKLFLSKPGGTTLYQFDPSGRWAYYYAHLDRYADGIAEGRAVRRGDVIGYVGSTGNASPDAPHLHFAVFRLGPDKRWWQGEAVDPLPLLR
jgi:murein DD-endopeptidase MepM/ murein hydrolase activator NlpD